MRRVVGVGCVFPLAAFTLHDGQAARSEGKDPPLGSATVYTSSPDDDPKLKGLPVMVSFVARGAVVQQGEIELGTLKTFDKLPAGAYEVRAEGEGMATVVKKGVTVTDKGDTDLRFPMRAGKGARVVEFAAGAPTAEELAARVAALEKAVAELKARK